MFDSSGREISYLRVSVTDRCNLACVYCVPEEGVEHLARESILSFERIAAVVAAAARLGVRKVRLTGGEPLVRKGIAELVGMIAPIPGIEKLGLTTNGTLLAPLAASLAAAGLGSVNVSLDTLDPGRYARLTRGGRIEEAMAGIRAARAAGLPVKLNVVVLEDSTEAELEGLRSWAAELGASVQLIARYDIHSQKLDGGKYDRPPRCGNCDRLRLLADGTLRPCLHSGLSIPVDFADIESSILKAVEAKPAHGGAGGDLEVGQIGG